MKAYRILTIFYFLFFLYLYHLPRHQNNATHILPSW